MKLVERLTRLNARHISATSRLAGAEIELLGIDARSAANAASPAPVTTSEDADRERLERERRELADARAAVDRERDALDLELKGIDEALASLDRTSDPTDRKG